ncbi:odorant receptor 22a-like [Euwallacea similis]|uniref:odorant receptor 22a-like n=1 Tax=Euwallacea similis TaxID=1736056 RepID=UPI00344D693D
MFTVTKWLLMATGCWTLPVEPYLQIPYKIYQIFIWVGYFCATLGFSANFFVYIGVDNDRAVEALSYSIVGILLTIKLLLLMTPSITGLVKTVTEDKFVGAKESLKMRRMVLSYKRFVGRVDIFFVVSSYSMVSLFTIKEALVEYLAYCKSHPNATEEPEYLLTIWVPVDMQKHFLLALHLQMYLVFQTGAQNYAALSMYITLMVYTALKLKILRHSLRNFSKHCTSEADVLRALNQLAREHQNIINFVQVLHKSFKPGLLIEYTASSLILASTIVQIIRGDKMCIFILSASLYTFQLFLLSWNSEKIRNQSLMMGTSLYKSDWYFYGAKVMRFILFMMLRSSKPLTLNIGPFGPNTMETAMARARLGYSYVTVMSS